MGQVLRHAEKPREIWRQHADILEAVIAGEADKASRLATDHCLLAAEKLGNALAKTNIGREA
jgi:DNA-binding GntR family transcriptional regulator